MVLIATSVRPGAGAGALGVCVPSDAAAAAAGAVSRVSRVALGFFSREAPGGPVVMGVSTVHIGDILGYFIVYIYIYTLFTPSIMINSECYSWIRLFIFQSQESYVVVGNFWYIYI